MPLDTKLAILASHKLGHVKQCEGVARALGLQADMRHVRPRKLFHLLAPWGPADPRDRGAAETAALRKPYPDIALASGRETVPYLRALKRLSGGKTFCVYLGDPRVSRARFDLVVLPEHDRYRANNVFVTLTPPHPRDALSHEEARARPDPRIAALSAPRFALLLGGPNATYKFAQRDIDTLADIANVALASGASLMVSASRRTPPALVDAMSAISEKHPQRIFVWDGAGENPYATVLALAEAFVVTADSVNMIGECIATGRPVHIYEPAGHPGKFAHLIGELRRRKIVRTWTGMFESWSYTPVDSTPRIAQEVAQRFIQFQRP